MKATRSSKTKVTIKQTTWQSISKDCMSPYRNTHVRELCDTCNSRAGAAEGTILLCVKRVTLCNVTSQTTCITDWLVYSVQYSLHFLQHL